MKTLNTKKVIASVISPVMITLGAILFYTTRLNVTNTMAEQLLPARTRIMMDGIAAVWIAVWLRASIALYRNTTDRHQLCINVYALIFALVSILFCVIFFSRLYVSEGGFTVMFTLILLGLFLSLEYR